MAYKPKYAKHSRPAAPHEPIYPVQEPERKPRKGILILFVLLGLLVVPAASWLTGNILLYMVQHVGSPKPADNYRVAQTQIAADLEAQVSGAMADAQALLLNTGRPDLPENAATETEPVEIEPVRKVYWIEEGTQVAPEPNQSLFGESNDPEVLRGVLQDAKWLLDGQATYFQPDGERYGDGNVHYYLDDSIFAITWQEVHDDSVYTFSEVKVSHPSQFRRHLAGGEYGSDMQFHTTEMAEAVNAVVASAGDFYRHRNFGAVVYEGVARRVEGTYAETCYIDSKGDMHFTRAGEVLTTAAVQEFVDEHDIEFSLAFGPILVDDYELVEHTWYGVGEIDEGYARAALCQMDQLHYIVVAANTTGIHQEIPTVAMFAKNIAATGCRMAYCLDGGQTATIVMNDELMNRPVYGQQRKISDIIYFATAVPNGGEDNG